jgi:predicted acyltransferase
MSFSPTAGKAGSGISSDTADAKVSSFPANTGSGGSPAATPSKPTAIETSQRLKSLDAYRGFIMLLMALNTGHWLGIAEEFPDSQLWQLLADQLEHRPWGGCSLWDMIQPSFSFMVGVSLPFSAAKRTAAGQSYGRLFLHAATRAVILILLGVFLRSLRYQTLNWTLIDTLSQIGLGYVFLFLLWNKPFKVQLGVLLLILVAYWSFFAFWPLPDTSFEPEAWGLNERQAAHNFSGFAAHWNFNANPGAYFEHWFYNRLPRPLNAAGNSVGPFTYNAGGYSVLNFIPTLATMILGLLVGGLLRSGRSNRQKLLLMLCSGAALVAAGWLLDFTGICPIVKRIWTPSWVLFSGGICFGILAGLYAIMDLAGFWRWAFPGIIVGMNPIVIYVLNDALAGWIIDRLRSIFGRDIFELFGEVYEPLFSTLAGLFILWLLCFWMYRRRIFIRI